MTLYLDTSSFVKLYVDEPGSDAIRRRVAEASLVATSAIAYAETRSAFARFRREGSVTLSGLTGIKADFERDWKTTLAVPLSDSVSADAGLLAERFDLRGCDAIHLASFVAILSRAGDDDVEFSSFDDRLNRAARKLS